MRAFPKGITLLETVLYIGILSIVLPTFTVFMLHIWQQQVGFDARMRLEQSSSMLFLELSNDLIESDSIQVSTSTLGTDSSVLRFKDAAGGNVVIDVATTTVAFNGTNQTVHRLRMQQGAAAAVWMTEPEHDVKQWRVDAVRNATGTLTGLRVSYNAEQINKTGNAYRKATFTATTVFALSPHTTEL